MSVLRAALHTNAILFHLHDPELIPIGFLLKALGKLVIFDSHEYYSRDLLDKDYIPVLLKSAMVKGTRVMLSLADSLFDAIVVAAPGMLNDYRNRNKTLINNYPEWKSEIDLTLRFVQRPPVVAYIGGISERRGIREVVAALEIVGHRMAVRLLLVGSFESPELEQEVRRLPGWRYVDYRGQVSRQEVKSLLDGSLCGLVTFHDAPNHRESSPNKLFEYLAAGLPAILSDFKSWRDLLDPIAAGLFVDPQNPKALADAICWVLTNRDLAEQMGKRGEQAVRDHFNWTTESEKLIRLYDQLLNEHNVKELV